MGELDGRVALITGGGRGQGRQHAITLARAGADIVICDTEATITSIPYVLSTKVDLDETAALVGAEGRSCVVVQADVRDRAAMELAATTALEEFGHLDIAVANAGICSAGGVNELSEQAWDDMLAVNLTGVYNTFRAVLPHMIARGYGRLVATSSGAGKTGTPNLSHYAASKWGVIGFVKSVALEVARFHITANVVCPATVDTPMVHNPELYALFAPDLAERTKETVRPRYEQMNPMGVAWLDPSDIAHAVRFLVGEGSRYISGETVEVSAAASATR